MAEKTTRVVFALDYKTEDGKNHRGGSEVSVNAPEARDLVHRGYARYVKESDAPAAAPQETKTDKAAK